MKKILLVILTIMVVSFVTGCSSEGEIKVTDEELSAISEYAAYLMLKYDRRANDHDRLIEAEKLAKQAAVNELSPEYLYSKNPIPTATPAPTPTPITAPKKEPTKAPTPTAKPTATPKPQPTEVPEDDRQDDGAEQGSIYVGIIDGTKASSINECFGSDEFSFRYLGSVRQKSYKSSSHYYAITAPEGKDLLVTKIAITNITDDEVRFVSDDYAVRYQLLVTDRKALEPRLTLLPNDIQLMDTVFTAGQSAETLLVFYIDSDAVSATLRVLGDYSDGTAGKAYDIKLK